MAPAWGPRGGHRRSGWAGRPWVVGWSRCGRRALVGHRATATYERRQFNTPIGRFEGVEQVIARMVGLGYIMDAARSVTTAAIDNGEKPAVPAAILKYLRK